MFDTVIVGFDGTDTGNDGLVLSIGLAKAFGSRVVLAYIYDEGISGEAIEAARERTEHAEAILAGAREQVSQALAVEFSALPASSPADGLHDLAVRADADLIVIGSRRLGPWTKSALGAVSESVMRAAPCAVVVASRGYRAGGGFVPQTIGVGWIPTKEGEDALAVSCRIARATGGRVEVVTTASSSATVEDLDARARHAVEDVLATLGHNVAVKVHARVGAAPDELVRRSSEMDLIVLGSRGYGPPRTMLSGSVSSKVVPVAHCPVMILGGSSRVEAQSRAARPT